MKTKTLLLSGLMLCTGMASAQVTIDIDAAKAGVRVSPHLYGIFFEDINHAADGGLYAELIRNRSFEDGPKYGAPADLQAWSTYAAAPSQLEARLIQPSKKVKLLNAAQGNALELVVDASAASPVCLVNEGYWGINAVQGRSYKLSFWLKGQYKGTIKATLCDAKGARVYAESEVSPYGMQEKQGYKLKNWQQYTATLTSNGNDPKAQFALVFDGKGTIDLDMVSLFPPTFKNRANGMRPDLASMLANLHPKFMRFPGGCFVEGQQSPDNAFRWERTIGPIEEREGHWNVNWGYRTTDGIGFHEYLQLAEDLGAKPLYVVNVGLWHGGLTPVDSLQPWIDECLNALEYANGDVTTKYGALRAKNGHPAPFNIEYLEIGNENNQPDPRQQSDRYYDRFKKFKDAVLAKYPGMHLIGNVVAWGDDNPKWGSGESVELLDEHYYRSPAWFADNFHKYDAYDRRGSKIYCGEYAVTQGFGDLGNQNAALGEAVFMMGMENNADIVEMASYAPIFVNENNVAWRPDMIRFNSAKAMGTPSYYVQRLMAENVGTRVLPVVQTDPYSPLLAKQGVTPDESRFGYATWDTQSSYQLLSMKQGDNLYTRDTPEDGWMLSGEWDVDGDVLKQTAHRQSCIYVSPKRIKGNSYELKVKARKDAGDEGFIVVFNYVDKDNYCWVNFGGWGNTQHGLEQVVNGSKMQTATCAGSVETDRWYDVTLRVEGDDVKAWLDDKLVFDAKLKADTSMGVFSSASLDEAMGEVILKVVNTTPENTTARVNLKNCVPMQARLIRLASEKGTDENSLDHPTRIYPVDEVITVDGDGLTLDVPANSLNIVRVK